jgi:hypothetical protein
MTPLFIKCVFNHLVKYWVMHMEILHYKYNKVFKRWECLRRSRREIPAAVIQAFGISLALVQKRQQSSVPHPWHPDVRTGHACEPVV